MTEQLNTSMSTRAVGGHWGFRAGERPAQICVLGAQVVTCAGQQGRG